MSDPNYWGDVQREEDKYRAGFERSQLLGRLLLVIAVALVGCALAVFW